MFLNVEEFRAWRNRSITLMGMSGVGKTHLSGVLREHNWFHYSGDYRIGTRYLDEEILDIIKCQAMQVPFLRDLLRQDYIYIRNNISVHNLGPVTSFLGKVGDPDRGGIPLPEFNRRQECYREAEVAAMLDVPEFIDKAHKIYGYPHFVNDVGGSLCELDDDDVLETLFRSTLLLYIEVSEGGESALIERADRNPKPMYYRKEFLDEQISVYLKESDIEYMALADPDDFIRWIFPRLFHARIPRYRAIAGRYGYTVSAEEVARVRDDEDFIELVETAIDRRGDELPGGD
ncbi:MAG: ATPase [Gammaproteobacteria bacterium]|nr:ATPase [Gammaproteobacteria bacterium]